MPEGPVTECTRFFRPKDIPHLELYRGTGIVRPVPKHVHFVFSLSVTESGGRKHITRKGEFDVVPGAVSVVNINELHSNAVPRGIAYASSSLRIESGLLRKLVFNITGKNSDYINVRKPVIIDRELAQDIIRLHRIIYTPAPKLEKECLLLDVFSRMITHHSGTDPLPESSASETYYIKTIREYLQEHPCENICLEDLVQITGLSSYYLSRIFSKGTGIPLHTYHIHVRLKHAADLLASGMPIIEAALETGFFDQSHFHRNFIKKFGVTPGCYASM
jgi:AraC-like DNA-binding protein